MNQSKKILEILQIQLSEEIQISSFEHIGQYTIVFRIPYSRYLRLPDPLPERVWAVNVDKKVLDLKDNLADIILENLRKIQEHFCKHHVSRAIAIPQDNGTYALHIRPHRDKDGQSIGQRELLTNYEGTGEGVRINTTVYAEIMKERQKDETLTSEVQ